MPRTYRRISDLPETIPVFPLGGAILFPHAHLPLNIFEPRYLAMVDAALAGDRLIGMIQPAGFAPEGSAPPSETPKLADVGCVGRITALQETDDNRYLITLRGVCRFHVARELPVETPFRSVAADYAAYAGDLTREAGMDDAARERLTEALKGYLARNNLDVDWSTIRETPSESLVNSLAAGCPFTAPEKQALLEAPTLQERCGALITLLMMERPGQGGGYVQ